MYGEPWRVHRRSRPPPGIIMKSISIIAISALLVISALLGIRYMSADRPAPIRMPPNAFLVSVRACDEESWVLPFKVTTEVGGKYVPIEDVAITHYTLSTFCQWSDCTTRTIRVESVGHIPREYTVSGKKNIIAILHSPEE